MSLRPLALFLVLIAAAGSAANEAAAARRELLSQLRMQVMAWQQSNLSSRDIGQQLMGLYQAHGLSEQVNTANLDLSNEQLDALFDVTALVSFYSKDPAISLQHLRVANLLALRERLAVAQANVTRGTAIAQRLFDNARPWEAFLTAGSFDPLPATIAGSSRVRGQSVWRVAPDDDRIDQIEVQLGSGLQVLMVSHPLCGFSRSAMSAIGADAALMQRLRGRLTIITPQDRSLDHVAIRRWNREHPAWPHHIVNAESEWLLLDRWYTPTFYVFNDDLLVEVVEGWPKDGSSRDRLLAALVKATTAAAVQAE